MANSLNDTLTQCHEKNSKIEIFGLGYVGFPLAIHLAQAGWRVNGVDVNPERIQRLAQNNLMESELHLKKEFL